ncbi:hypothetical protein TNCV_4894181 [Trichonephila clavipes]|nr:hypothetical protein TNCV_4894181 [Trichonephila clavipes]
MVAGFILQTNPEQPDEEATYKEKLDLQLRKDRCYTLIYTNISSNLKNLITETTDGSTVQQIYRWKGSELSKLKQSILESSSVDETRFGESGECLLEQFHFEEVEDLPGATAAVKYKWQE